MIAVIWRMKIEMMKQTEKLVENFSGGGKGGWTFLIERENRWANGRVWRERERERERKRVTKVFLFRQKIDAFLWFVCRVTLVAHSPKTLVENMYKSVSFHGVWCHVDLATCLPCTRVSRPTLTGSTPNWNKFRFDPVLSVLLEYSTTISSSLCWEQIKLKQSQKKNK